MNRQRVAVLSGARTAIGKFGGALREVAAPELGSVVIRAALARAALAPDSVDEVIMGNVFQAGVGPNPARVAAVAAGVPYEVPAMTVNKLCGSGLKSLTLAAQAIAAGAAEAVVAGGMESMSGAPYLVGAGRWGAKMGHQRSIDSMLHDGLWDCFYDCHMGDTAENLAVEYGVSRTEQDRYALQSQQRYQTAHAADRFADELVAMPAAAGHPFEVDEHPRSDTSAAALDALRPAFRADGTVTAGNSSGISDGAAALVLASEERAAQIGTEPLGFLRGYATVGVDPQVMGIGPAGAIAKLLTNAGMTLDDIDLVEVNEAFAAQTLAVGCKLGWDEQRVNVNGGAIALGHPVGASGARIAATLLFEMRRRAARFGVAALCIGGGMGIAALFERP